MTTKKHNKHAKISRRKGGLYHRHELAILGAPCGHINLLVSKLVTDLAPLKIGYIDADHHATSPPKLVKSKSAQSSSSESETAHPAFVPLALSEDQNLQGAFRPAEVHRPSLDGVLKTQFTDKIAFEQFNRMPDGSQHHLEAIFNDCDIVLVNGNHFKADRQLVWLTHKKEASLSRKLDRLTNVIGFIQDEDKLEVFDFLKTTIPKWQELPIFPVNTSEDISTSVDSLAEWISVQMPAPILKGLVLNGGKSERMGQDKGSINYHGQPQREHMASLLNQFCDSTAISVRSGSTIESSNSLLSDEFLNMGPMSGILSAFKQDPNAAWLVVACDQPAIDERIIQQLIEERDTSALATCFHNPDTDFPEPLLTIWEPRAYPVLLQFMARGYSCPRKVLINSCVKEIKAEDSRFLLNVNTPEEYQDFIKPSNSQA